MSRVAATPDTPERVPTSSSPTASAARSGGPGAPGGPGPAATLDARWRPAFVDNDARPVPTIRKDVAIQEGVL